MLPNPLMSQPFPPLSSWPPRVDLTNFLWPKASGKPGQASTSLYLRGYGSQKLQAKGACRAELPNLRLCAFGITQQPPTLGSRDG